MIMPFLPLAVEANNALDVLLKGLDTVVAQAVAEAGAEVGHGGVLGGALGWRSAHVTVQGQHFGYLKSQSADLSKQQTE